LPKNPALPWQLVYCRNLRDYDGDGRLDLFVAGYVHYDIDHPPVPGSAVVAFPTCQFRGINVMCGRVD